MTAGWHRSTVCACLKRPPVKTFALTNVLVRRCTKFGWHCEKDGLPVFIATAQLARGEPIPALGTRGTLHLLKFAFADLYPAALARGLQ